MAFIFFIEQVNTFQDSGLYLLDGLLVEGAIINGSRCRVIGAVDFDIIVKHVGLVYPSHGENKLSVSIECPPCPLKLLIGCKLVAP
jgi:hypothetical protein